MVATLEKLYRTMGRLTVVLMFAFLAVFGVAMGFALVGVRQPAESLGNMAWVVAFLFSGMFGLFLLTALVAATLRWSDRRKLAVRFRKGI